MAVPSRACLSFMRTAVRAMQHQDSSPGISKLPEIFQPPINRSMRELDRSFFNKIVHLASAAPITAKDISSVSRKLISSRDILNLARIKPIWDSSTSPSGKCIVLDPSISPTDPSTWTPAVKSVVQDSQLALIQPFTLHLTYSDWSLHDILHSILPEDAHSEIPSGFAQVGHVAHVNIREQYLPYRHLIGQILLDKNPKIRTVINKIEDVGSDNVFRTFPYEVLAGPDDMDVTVSHNDCVFHFNFAKVYWNTRLHTEHTRIMDKFREGEAVCDVMAGVGPFVIPSAKWKRVFVRANDLNPESYKAMGDAVRANKVDDLVRTYLLDGREFIRLSARELMVQQRTATVVDKMKGKDAKGQKKVVAQQIRKLKEPKTVDHYVMNLPASAVEFLDAFNGLYKGHEDLFDPVTKDRTLPLIHVYLFCAKSEAEDAEVAKQEEADACCARVSEHLGCVITPETPEVEVWDVRLVSPKKKMFCVSFRLPKQIAFGK